MGGTDIKDNLRFFAEAARTMSDRLSTSSALPIDSGGLSHSMHHEIGLEEGRGEKEACVAPRLHFPQVCFCLVHIRS